MSLRETGSSSITKFGVSVTCGGSPTVRPSLDLVLKKINKWNMGLTVRPSLSSFLGRTSVIVAELEGGQ